MLKSFKQMYIYTYIMIYYLQVSGPRLTNIGYSPEEGITFTDTVGYEESAAHNNGICIYLLSMRLPFVCEFYLNVLISYDSLNLKNQNTFSATNVRNRLSYKSL